MPDHLHLLFSLGARHLLADCIRLFKGPLTPIFRTQSLRWQDGYYEHHMRPDEDRLPVFLYIFLNTYRASLLFSSEKWQAYFCSPEDQSWFASLTNLDTPFPSWLT
jgi:hypothetical protein